MFFRVDLRWEFDGGEELLARFLRGAGVFFEAELLGERTEFHEICSSGETSTALALRSSPLPSRSESGNLVAGVEGKAFDGECGGASC